jgi:anti-sigma regulatory factor (Ser/Thr protein kinase)
MMNLELRATPEEVMRAVEALQDYARTEGVPEDAIFGLALALEECGSNIVNHACTRDERQKFQVHLERTPGSFLIELRDNGPEFDPTKAQEKKKISTNGECDDDPPGGWGIGLVRRYVDEIRYQRDSGINVLRLVRHFSSQPTKT